MLRGSSVYGVETSYTTADGFQGTRNHDLCNLLQLTVMMNGLLGAISSFRRIVMLRSDSSPVPRITFIS